MTKFPISILIALLAVITTSAQISSSSFQQRLLLGAEGHFCKADDFTYRYTQCDDHGQRWRYALPKSPLLHCANVPPPTAGINCCGSLAVEYHLLSSISAFSCPAGSHLDMETQECRLCTAGTFSLGDGVRYEEMEGWPPGFTVENFPDETEQRGEGGGGDGADQCSNQAGWVVQAGEIRYVPTACLSRLSISLNLVHDGYVEFNYRMPRNSRGLISILQVRNAQCQSYGDVRGGLGQSETNEGEGSSEYRVRRLQVQKGQNLVTWTVASSRELTSLADIIHVPKVDINGFAFTPACSTCTAGTYSWEGAKVCSPCAENSFSGRGQSKCTPCSPDEYSPPKSPHCTGRPLCRDIDYFPQFNGQCSKGKERTISYERVRPHICIVDPSSPSPLPSNKSVPCRACQPGMQRDPTSGKCRSCPHPDEYSPEGTFCKKCPEGMTPIYGLHFQRWERLPPEMTSTCEYIGSDEPSDCSISPAWVPMGDYLQSAQSRLKGIAFELSVGVETGFYDPMRMGGAGTKATVDNPLGTIRMEVETRCADESCQLYLVQESSLRNSTTQQQQYNVLHSLNGPQHRHIIHSPILEAGPTRFVLAFMRSDSAVEMDALNDVAIVYSINISGVGDVIKKEVMGGAAACVECPQRDEQKRCKPCAMGHYLEKGVMGGAATCIQCPPSTVLNLTSSRVGRESCIACGPNLGSEDGSACSFTGKFQLLSAAEGNRSIRFDLSALKGTPLMAKGVRMFAREGNPYFHSFNVSLFADHPVVCRDTLSMGVGGLLAVKQAGKGVAEVPEEAMFCRAASIPAPAPSNSNSSSPNEVFHVSSTIVSRRLAAITQERNFGPFHLSNDQLEYDATLSAEARPIDVHFFFEPAPTRLRTCPHGTLGVITTRCNPTVATTNPEVHLSKKCPDGTCDGCLFHVIVESAHACPVCHREDFEQLRGECVNNEQKIHFLPSKHCILSGVQMKERVEGCSSSASGRLKLVLLIASVLIALLVVIIGVIYQRNKTLEYRYSRLVEGKGGDNVMNSCALETDEEEEEEDDVDASRARVFFGKKGAPGKKRDANYPLVASAKPAGGDAKKKAGAPEEQEFLTDSSD